MSQTIATSSRFSAFRSGAVVALAGVTLGVLSAYGQSWLPSEIGSLANSAGPWCLIAAVLALLAASQFAAAAFGALALAALLAGYVIASSYRGFPSSDGLMMFWGLAALVVGPLLGLGARWIESNKPIFNSLGVGGITGLLVGEGVYGLMYISDSTYPPYWWTEIGIGVALLAWASAQRLRQTRPVALAVGIHVLVAVAFVAIYQLNLIGILP